MDSKPEPPPAYGATPTYGVPSYSEAPPAYSAAPPAYAASPPAYGASPPAYSAGAPNAYAAPPGYAGVSVSYQAQPSYQVPTTTRVTTVTSNMDPVTYEAIRNRFKILLGMGIFFVILGIIVTIVTAILTTWYFVWFGLWIAGIILISRGAWGLRMFPPRAHGGYVRV
eukprot:TRINITY_DN2720_c0_g1_i1.p1 TRINITY_DN2720_c0_g1~~TRINITY_DN2720_c0_g1_i1.p1  ORF type:complete len:168 (+),score=17.57 TRINITY_DN2720_c0_g1_i1:25-528(+)